MQAYTKYYPIVHLRRQISRMLAAKASLAARVDALGEEVGTEMGIENRAKLESRLKMFEDGQVCVEPRY